MRTLANVRRTLPWGIAAAALAFGVWRAVTPSGGPERPVRFVLTLPENNNLANIGGNTLAVSPDGQTLAYIGVAEGTRRIYLRDVGDLRPRVVTGTELATTPFFSPEGKWLGFVASGQLRKVPVEGGTAVALADVASWAGASWSRNGQIVMSANSRVVVTSAAGGTPRVLSALDTARRETAELWPVVLDDGETVLYGSMGAGGVPGMHIGVLSLKDGRKTILDVLGTFPIGVVDGHLVYASSAGALMAIPIDIGGRRTSGSPFPIVDQVVVGTNGEGKVGLSPLGTLVYQSGNSRAQLTEVQPDGTMRALVPDQRAFAWPRYSPDGRHIAVTISAQTQTDVWIYDLPAGPLRRLTTEGTLNDRPEWTPDSRRVLFRSDRSRRRNALWTQPFDNSGPAQLFYGLDDSDVDEGVISPDGHYLVFQRDTTGTGDLMYRRLDGDTARKPIETSRFAETSPRLSPDGRWVAYSSQESGVAQVYVKPFPSLDAKYQVSLEVGSTPVWSRDGKRIYYTVTDQLVAADISTAGGFSVLSRKSVLAGNYQFGIGRAHAQFDISPDGKRFVVLRSTTADAQVVVVYGWRADLRRRVAEQGGR